MTENMRRVWRGNPARPGSNQGGQLALSCDCIELGLARPANGSTLTDHCHRLSRTPSALTPRLMMQIVPCIRKLHHICCLRALLSLCTTPRLRRIRRVLRGVLRVGEADVRAACPDGVSAATFFDLLNVTCLPCGIDSLGPGTPLHAAPTSENNYAARFRAAF